MKMKRFLSISLLTIILLGLGSDINCSWLKKAKKATERARKGWGTGKELLKQFQKEMSDRDLDILIKTVRCDAIGKLGRSLRVLEDNVKAAICKHCKSEFERNHPMAKDAVCPKPAEVPVAPPIPPKPAPPLPPRPKTASEVLPIPPRVPPKPGVVEEEIKPGLSAETLGKLKEGNNKPEAVAYVDISKLTPGQLRMSELNVQDKVNKAKGLQFDDGRSIFSTESPLPIILGPEGLVVLVDGHHDTLASIKLGAKTVPVYLKKDMRKIPTVQEFWKQAEKEGHVYPYNLEGQRVIPTSFDQLQNDSIRYFMAITAFKCLGGEVKEKPKRVVWLKLGKGIPFFEFIAADILKNNGFKFTEEDAKLLKRYMADPTKLTDPERSKINFAITKALNILKTSRKITELLRDPRYIGQMRLANGESSQEVLAGLSDEEKKLCPVTSI